MFVRRLLPLFVVVLALAGCVTARGGTPAAADPPGDFAATIVYRNGSVPLPHRYEWRLLLGAREAELRWRPGYDSAEEPFVETVAVTAGQRATLYARLRDSGVLDDPPTGDDGLVGGATGEVEVVADGRTHTVGPLGLNQEGADVLADVRAAAADLLPPEVWAAMADRQRAWGEEQG